MSETVSTNANGDPNTISEVTKSNQNDAAAPATPVNIESSIAAAVEVQKAPVQCTEPQTAPLIEGQNAPVAEIKVENTPVNVAQTTDVAETKVALVTEAPKACTMEENKQSPIVPEFQQMDSIGAGDLCVIVKPNENGAVPEENKEKSIPSVTDKTCPVGDKAKVADNDELIISKLKETVQKTAEERDSYQKKLKGTEKKLADLQALYDTLIKGGGDEVMLRRMVEQLKSKLVQTSLQLEDRVRIVTNQEKQISALNSQVASLKEVESLTRNLLQIRNMEVKHLQTEVDDMEVKINEERERYNTMISKMDSAVKLNADLKKEYETQLCLFRDLRDKYEEKVSLLSEEKRALENAQPVPQ